MGNVQMCAKALKPVCVPDPVVKKAEKKAEPKKEEKKEVAAAPA